jgi:hypothetical protein
MQVSFHGIAQKIKNNILNVSFSNDLHEIGLIESG